MSIGSFIRFISKKIHSIGTLSYMIWTYGKSLTALKKFRDQEGSNLVAMFHSYNHKDYYHVYNKYLPPHLIHSNAREFLTEKYNVGKKLIDEMLEPVTRNIYSQDLTDYHSLAMATTVLSGESSKLRTFKNGNGTFFEAVAKSIEQCSIRCNTNVTKIKQVGDQFVINDSETFDAVVVAVPLEKCNIKFENIPGLDSIPKRVFVPVCLTVVRGTANPQYFGVDQVPQVIRTTRSSGTLFEILLT
jgi:hypothetical protein